MILVSACLAGINCKYDGKNNSNEYVLQLVKEGKAIPVCPEQLGGLPTPRPCSEIIIDKNGNKKVINNLDEDVTKAFEKGAKETLKIAKSCNAHTAILKAKSPSCGFSKVYDGTFCGKLTDGNGLTADLLNKNGIKIIQK